MRESFSLRVRIILGVVIGVLAILALRLYILQIRHGDAYAAEANHQYMRSARDIFDRGSIYFTQKNGERIAAASLRTGYLLAIDPTHIKDPERLYTILSTYLTLDKEKFMDRAMRKDDPYEEIARHIESDTADTIRGLALPGVQLFREQWRYYPGDTLGAHALGFVGYGDDGTTLQGQYGLERYWDSYLNREGDHLYVNFFAEIFENMRGVLEEKTETTTGNLITTVEPAVQQALERTLKQAESEWHAKQIGGIIMDPKTGEILALGALPTYDPNTYSEVKDGSVFHDVLVENVFEMGSIIKPIAMAIGLDTGAITAHTTYNDTGSVTIDTKTIRNYDGKARGVIDMQQVLNQSLNVGMAYVAKKVGGKAMGDGMRAFGFGEETGIDLPFEVHGIITNLESPREVEYATAAFGQGIALTPVETARALSALGNGGYLVTPHLVKAVEDEEGNLRSVEPTDRVQVIKQSTSEEITRMLVNVVDHALRGGTVKKDRYSIAAKTGTAQIAKSGERGYYDDRFLHSFFGYFPAYDPRFMIFLFHVEPQGAKYASETLTDPFMDLVDFLVNYYQIPPDR